jgi:hypothetical protein
MADRIVQPNSLRPNPLEKKPPMRWHEDAGGHTQNIAKLLYSRREAAFALGISIRALDYLLAGKSIQTRRIGARVLIHRDELIKWASRDHSKPVAA